MKKSQKKQLNLKNKILYFLKYLIVEILFILILVTVYIKKSYSNVSFEQLIYSLQTAEGTSNDMLVSGVKFVIPWFILINICFYLSIFIRKKYFVKELCLNLYFKDKKKTFNLFPLNIKEKKIIFILYIIISIFLILYSIGFINYVFLNKDNRFFEKYYIDPKTVEIDAPSDKRNLIFIYVESLETTLFSIENGGNFNKSIIPNLENIDKENLNFSSSDNLGGASMVSGTSWTAAGLVSTSSGIPLKLSSSDGNIYWDYKGSYLPGAYSLGEILEKNGYHNYFMLGSNAGFGGRSLYFNQHGNYEIWDYGHAIRQGWIDENYDVWWGYEDSKLYDFAKKELKEISLNDEPFNFTLLTADTHPNDGYCDDSCVEISDVKYLNSYNCTDKMLGEFVNWIKNQDFYDDTTIVILGDHLTMQSNLKDSFDKEGQGYIYNAFINSKVDGNNKNRSFTSMDMYPTVLSSLGFKIKGERLGLGTNLFSGKQTLAEELGIEKLNKELENKSNFYNNVIVKEDSLKASK